MSKDLECYIERDQVIEEQRCLRFDVPRKYTGNSRMDYVEFWYSNIMDAAVSLLLNKEVIAKEGDILWRADLYDEDGNRKYTPNLNSGDWWERTEKLILGGAEGVLLEDGHILPLIVFIDDTQVVNRGNRSATPIVLTLGVLPEHIRQKDVSDSVFLMFLYYSIYRFHEILL